MRTAHSMARNALAMLNSQVITWAASFLLVMYLPRSLGAAGYGKLQFSLAFMGIFAIFINFGTNRLVTREVARNRSKAPAYLTNVLALKSATALIAYPGLILTAVLLHRPTDVMQLIYIFGVAMVLGAINAMLDSILQAYEEVHRLAWGDIQDKLLKTALVLALLFHGKGIVAIAWAMVSITVLHLIRNGYWVLRLVRPRAHLLSLRFTRDLLTQSLPFLLFSVFAMVYDKIDITMLGMMTSDEVVGWYSAAYRLFHSLFFLPHTFNMVVFPVLSRLSAGDQTTYRQAVHRGWALLSAATVGVSICTFVLAGPVVEVLYTQARFPGTVAALQVLAVALGFQYLNTMVVMVLQTMDRQAQWAKAGAAAALFNPAVNYLLIPLFGHVGAALTTAFTEALLMTIALRACPRGIFDRSDLRALLRAFLAGIPLAAGLALGLRWGMVPALALGLSVYAWAVLRLGLVAKSDVALLKDAAMRIATKRRKARSTKGTGPRGAS